MKSIAVGIVEDDTVIRKSLEMFVSSSPTMSLFFSAASVEDAFVLIESLDIEALDVLLLDIGLPGMTGIEGLKPLKSALPSTDIIMLTTYDDTETIFQALSSGACSYISKKTSLKTIGDAIQTVFNGGSYMSPAIARKIAENIYKPKKADQKFEAFQKLTPKQNEIVQGLVSGLSYKMIAAKLNISIDTVRTHIKNIYRTLEVNNKIEVLNLFNKK